MVTTKIRRLSSSSPVAGARFQAIFFRSLSTMFGAGIPLVSCFDQLSEQAESEEAARLAEELATRLRKGETLYRAMAAQEDVFSKLQIHLVRIGMDSGMLEVIFRQIADYEEQRRALILQLRASLTYPCFVFLASLIGLLLLPTLAMDSLFAILTESGQELPYLTQLIILWSDLLGSPIFYLGAIVALGGLSVLGQAAWKVSEVRDAFYEATMSIPVVSQFLRLVATLRFARCLQVQLRAGVNILLAVPMACEATGWEPTKRSGEQILDYLKSGLTISEALSRQALYDSLLIEMVRAGEETGKLPYTLSRTVALYEQEVNYIIEIAVGLLEPIMMGFLGVICATFVIGVALPLVQLLQTLG